MKTTDLKDEELATYSGEHLLYGLQVCQWTAAELQSPVKTDVLRSVLIESFGMHLRNLIDFFFTPRVKGDDVIAADFCPGWNETMPATLNQARARANKELSHLTLGRKSGLHPDKPWDVAGLFKEVQEVAQRFAAKASPTKLHADVRKFLALPRANAIAVVASMTTSNTTSTVVMTVPSGQDLFSPRK
jgi:hypothetical protein